MALTSSSTLDDALNQYKDNLSWDGNLAKARAALEAIRYIEMCRPQILARPDGGSLNFNLIGNQAKRLEAYLDQADTSLRPTASFTRGLCKDV